MGVVRARGRRVAVAVVARRRRVEVDPGVLDRRLGLGPVALRVVARRAAPQAFIGRAGRGAGPTRGTLPSHRVYRAQRRTDALSRTDPFGARAPPRRRASRTTTGSTSSATGSTSARAPVTLKILLENVLRHAGGGIVRAEDVETLAAWRPGVAAEAEIPFMPARVLLQDFTGVPAVVDLAVMRDAMADLGGDPARVNPLVPADLVIDHSVQVDRFGTPGAFAFNVEREYERNGERYQLLRWAQTAFRDLRVVPPGTGIVHQVNLEFLATVVDDRDDDGGRVAFPDTLVGTDSHTTMINALGVLGYGVGGIEAEAVLLGQPLYQPMPHVVGVRLDRRAAAGLDRDRPRPRRDRDAARARRRRRVRRVRRRRAGRPVARRPGDDQQHEPRVRGDRRRSSRSTTRRSPTCG